MGFLYSQEEVEVDSLIHSSSIRYYIHAREDFNLGLPVSVYLNLTHTLNRSATTAGFHDLLYCKKYFKLSFEIVKTKNVFISNCQIQ